MTVLVELRIAAERFRLGACLARHQGLQAELERVVPIGDHVLPYVWVTGRAQPLDALTETLEQSAGTSAVTTLDRLDATDTAEKQQLYRIEWVREELDLVNGILTAEGAIMDGKSVDDAWVFHLRFPDHAHVAQFYRYMPEHDMTEFSIHRLHEPQTRPARGLQYHLTAEQREAITLAAEQGYFDTPREVTLAELGAELGISEQAVSQRIRRANRAIILAVLHQSGGFN